MRLCNECCCCCFLAAVPGFCSPDLLLGAAILSATYGKTSNVVLLFYTTSEVYTNFGASSVLGAEKLLTAVHYGIASNVFVCLGEQGDSYWLICLAPLQYQRGLCTGSSAPVSNHYDNRPISSLLRKRAFFSCFVTLMGDAMPVNTLNTFAKLTISSNVISFILYISILCRINFQERLSESLH